MSDNTHEQGHGDSVASWTAVTIIMIAFTIGTFAFWFDQPAIVIASGVLAIAGIPVGMILKKMGYGVGGSKSKSKH
ncbi:DUF6704 family protein [Rhodoluna limnophila]|uniref:DUF6704 family protein n=1 Tax=Rhodoluna limnophila TaxID=232537 RepID=UPI0011066911|nr:DUF6704 family protein [Rhodoluna limnophila]